jgi:hypothetical protein
MRRLLREPLVHFLLGGALLFVLYGRIAEPQAERPDRIVVREEQVAMLAQSFERTWMRPPTEMELRGLVDDHVTEEVLYREALALGLDRDDLVVRRRMRQKMEFLNDDLAELEPTEEEMRAYLEANPERFRVPSRVSFAQLFLGPEVGAAAADRAGGLLARLRAGEDPEGLGAPSLLPRELDAASPSEVAGVFGARFAEALGELPEGAWSGPVASEFGAHLVLVSTREAGRLPPLEEVRGAVAREWAAARGQEARQRFHDALRARYEIEVRLPSAAPAPEMAGAP